jgi:hypothetical protein
MKKIISFSFALFCTCSSLFAQENTTTTGTTKHEGQTSFFAELGGPGILFSANIDRRFKKTHLGWGIRGGLGFVTYYEDEYIEVPGGGGYYSSGDQRSVVTGPVQLNYIFGKGNSPHSFEVGGGLTLTGKKIDVFNYTNKEETALFGTASFMYRRQPVAGGFSWRAGFTPLIAKGFIQPSGAVSVGYNF